MNRIESASKEVTENILAKVKFSTTSVSRTILTATQQYNCAMLRTLMALLLALCPVATCQPPNRPPDCSTLTYFRHKVSCLCGIVEVCAGDICGGPSVYELDDDITVELRNKKGTTLDTQKAVVEMIE